MLVESIELRHGGDRTAIVYARLIFTVNQFRYYIGITAVNRLTYTKNTDWIN